MELSGDDAGVDLGQSLGTRIAKRRHQLRLSQDELAAQVGVSRDAVSKWENDRTYPKRNLGRLEQVLGIRLDGAPPPGVDFDPGDPDEVRVAGWDYLTAQRRQELIDELRAARRGGLSTGT